MGVCRGVLLGIAFWAIFGLIWLLGACAPIIQVQPCECPQRVEVMPRGDFPDIPGDWKWYLPTYPPQEVPDYLLYEIPADAVINNVYSDKEVR